MSYFDIRFTNERIALDIAASAEENGGRATVEDILPIAATPCCIIPFKEVDDADFKILMGAIKNFMRKHSRFLNFTKEGVLEGLRLEWLPMLKNDDNVYFFKDISIIERIDHNDFVTLRENLFRDFAKNQKPDYGKYDNEPYIPRTASK